MYLNWRCVIGYLPTYSVQSPDHSRDDQMSDADNNGCHLHHFPDHPVLHYGDLDVDLSSAAPGLVIYVQSSAIT